MRESFPLDDAALEKAIEFVRDDQRWERAANLYLDDCSDFCPEALEVLEDWTERFMERFGLDERRARAAVMHYAILRYGGVQ